MNEGQGFCNPDSSDGGFLSFVNAHGSGSTKKTKGKASNRTPVLSDRIRKKKTGAEDTFSPHGRGPNRKTASRSRVELQSSSRDLESIQSGTASKAFEIESSASAQLMSADEVSPALTGGRAQPLSTTPELSVYVPFHMSATVKELMETGSGTPLSWRFTYDQVAGFGIPQDARITGATVADLHSTFPVRMIGVAQLMSKERNLLRGCYAHANPDCPTLGHFAVDPHSRDKINTFPVVPPQAIQEKTFLDKVKESNDEEMRETQARAGGAGVADTFPYKCTNLRDHSVFTLNRNKGVVEIAKGHPVMHAVMDSAYKLAERSGFEANSEGERTFVGKKMSKVMKEVFRSHELTGYEMSLEDYEHWEGSVIKKEKLYGMRLMDLADQQSGLTLVMCPTEAKFSNEPSSSIWDDIRNAPLVRSELMRSDSRAQAAYFEEPRFISGMIQIFYKC